MKIEIKTDDDRSSYEAEYKPREHNSEPTSASFPRSQGKTRDETVNSICLPWILFASL